MAEHSVGTHAQRLALVEKRMPIMSKLALERFVSVNPHWNGAHWADVLAMLVDTDSNLGVIEPIYSILEPHLGPDDRPYIALVTLTMYWAQPDRPIDPHAVLLRIRSFK